MTGTYTHRITKYICLTNLINIYMTQTQYFCNYMDLIGSFTLPKDNFAGILHTRQIYENRIRTNLHVCKLYKLVITIYVSLQLCIINVLKYLKGML